MEYVARVLSNGAARVGSTNYLKLSRWVLSRIFLLIGWAFVILGLLEMLTPLPFGIPLIVLGVTIILNTSPSARKAFVVLGRRHPATVGRVRSLLRARRRATYRRRADAE